MIVSQGAPRLRIPSTRRNQRASEVDRVRCPPQAGRRPTSGWPAAPEGRFGGPHTLPPPPPPRVAVAPCTRLGFDQLSGLTLDWREASLPNEAIRNRVAPLPLSLSFTWGSNLVSIPVDTPGPGSLCRVAAAETGPGQNPGGEGEGFCTWSSDTTKVKEARRGWPQRWRANCWAPRTAFQGTVLMATGSIRDLIGRDRNRGRLVNARPGPVIWHQM